MKGVTRACVFSMVVCGAIAMAPSVQAVTLGETNTSSVPCDGPATYVQSSSTAPGYEVPPGGGVITSWSTYATTGRAQVRLAIMRRTGTSGQFTTVAASAPELLTAQSLNRFATRLRVEAGDLLGYLIDSGAHTCVLLDAGTNQDLGFREVGTVFDVGTTGTYSEPSQPNRRLNLSAVLEADADSDGIGDDPPTTKLLEHPAKRGKDRTVEFTFSSNDPGAKFECSLDSSRFKRCASPRRYSVPPGHHEFEVRAVDPDRHRDRSPATFGFKVTG